MQTDCRTWSDAAFDGVWSGSERFADPIEWTLDLYGLKPGHEILVFIAYGYSHRLNMRVGKRTHLRPNCVCPSSDATDESAL